MSPKFTSKTQLAEQLGISTDTLRVYTKKAGVQTGHRKLLWQSEVERIRKAFDEYFQQSA